MHGFQALPFKLAKVQTNTSLLLKKAFEEDKEFFEFM
jgi:hypothetical protein